MNRPLTALHLLPFVAFLGVAAWVFSCAEGGGSAGEAGFAGSGHGGGAGAAAGGSGGAGGVTLDAPVGDGELTESGACAAESYVGQYVPLDLLILLDWSSSMMESGNTAHDERWAPVKTTLTAFVSDPKADWIGVGLSYFPLMPPENLKIPDQCTSDTECGFYGPCLGNVCSSWDCLSDYCGTACDPADYQNPEVPIQELPGVKDTILKSLEAHTPPLGGMTSTHPALAGTIEYAKGWATSHPNHNTNILFATDGEPNNCSVVDMASIAKIAETGVTGTPSIKTYVLAIGSELAALDAVAKAGGTNKAYLAGTGEAAEKLLAVLNEIRLSGVCQFQIPIPESGTPNYNLVNVTYVPKGADRQTIKGVKDVGSCNPTQGGWYYDNAQHPEKIILCDATCEQVKLSDQAVEVLLGCQTVVY